MIARVTLEIAVGKEFDYRIPPELEGWVMVGTRVRVPLGRREVLGCVTSMAEHSEHRELKSIAKVIGSPEMITPPVMRLARWIARYYCCPLEVALKCVLPEAVRKEQARWKQQLFVHALPVTGEMPKLTARQGEVWKIIDEWREMPLQELITVARTTAETVRRLEDKGLLDIGPQISERDPYAREHILPTRPLALNEEQSSALKEILGVFDSLSQQPSKGSAISAPRSGSATFLLHGVTGSGKTEVYLQAIARSMEQGKGAIVLVPEISLTPQTVERFKARFCSGPNPTLVAVLHSHLSSGERHDEWHKIRQGRARIVIGARSAIFAPVEPLGLIVVDEEHEHSYKQEEAPRYHARDVAVVRGQQESAVVILGSATPSMESYNNAAKGKYRLLELAQRADDKTMPLVRVIDMRYEKRKEKGTPVFSRRLVEAITNRLDEKEQVMLFLNRRGYASSLQCPKCGYVANCPNCSVSLTYHRARQILLCHICGHRERAPSACPQSNCKNPAIRFAGVGTERVEETLGKLFPKAEIRRMDSDTLKRKEDYRRILGDFRTGKIDILIGTQMIAKGLHFPNVTLVGIIYADLSLHQPDFRAGERTFQLLTQVSGRAGRGDIEGEVIVQAFTPFHPAIQYARKHDYLGFYEQEIEFREQLRYPPLGRIALVSFRGRNEDKVRRVADHVRSELEEALKDFAGLVFAGPAPAPLVRAEKFYRYQIMLRFPQMSRLSRSLAGFLQRFRAGDDVTVSVDIDPVDMG